jgi:hypothetical protein
MNLNNALSRGSQASEVTAVRPESKLPQKKEANDILRDILLSQIVSQPPEEASVETSKAEQKVVQAPASETFHKPSANPTKPLKDKEVIQTPVSRPSQEPSAKALKDIQEVAQVAKPLLDALFVEPSKDNQEVLQDPKPQTPEDLSTEPTKPDQEIEQDIKSQASQDISVEHSKSVHSETEDPKEVRKSKKKTKRKPHRNPTGKPDPKLSISDNMHVDGSHSSDANDSPTTDTFKRSISMASAVSDTSITTAEDSKHSKTDSFGPSSASTLKSRSMSGKSQKQRQPGHSKKGSNNSQGSNGSIRKADIEKSDTSSRNLNDPTDWPALGPAKPSVSAGLDSKPPAVPAVRSNNERIASIKVVPAIPLNMERRRQS